MIQFLARVSVRWPWWTITLWVVLVLIGVPLTATLLDSATSSKSRLPGNVESDRSGHQALSVFGQSAISSPDGENPEVRYCSRGTELVGPKLLANSCARVCDCSCLPV